MAGLFLRWSWWFFKSNQDHKRRFLFRKSGLKKAFKTTLATALLMEYGLGCKRDSVGASLSEAQPFLGSLTNEKLPYIGSFYFVYKKAFSREGALTMFPFKRRF